MEKNLKYLREYAKEKIIQRFIELKNNEYLPNDILTIIISILPKVHSNLL